MTDPEGRRVGATFLRNNLDKRSVGVDLKHPEGRELFLDLAPQFDVVAENFKAGDDGPPRPRLRRRRRRRTRRSIYLSVSGFGNTGRDARTALARLRRRSSRPCRASTSTSAGPTSRRCRPRSARSATSAPALFAAIGMLAALRHRDRTGEGQYVDVAMLDAMVAMTDIVTNFWSMGLRTAELEAGSMSCDGLPGRRRLVHRAGRPASTSSPALAELVGHPEWLDDPRFADPAGLARRTSTTCSARRSRRGPPTRPKLEAATRWARPASPPGRALPRAEVIADPHVAARNMLVEVPAHRRRRRSRCSSPATRSSCRRWPKGPRPGVPWLGEHTDEVLAAELGLGAAQLDALRDAGAIG